MHRRPVIYQARDVCRRMGECLRGRLARIRTVSGQPFFRWQVERKRRIVTSMAKHFLLYISAANDMEAERDLLARSVIALPVDLTWRIELSPRANDPVDQQAIAQADLHLLLLGHDIRAPIGLEWLVARRFGRSPLPLLKEGASRTLAAEEFRRFIELRANWRTFAGRAQLRQQVQQLLGRSILDQAVTYGLLPDEIVQLQAWLAEADEAPDLAEVPLGGAGDSSLIFSKERYEPASGILLRPRGKGEERESGP